MKTLLKIVLLFLLNFSFYLNANAQKPITWQRTYGDSGEDVGHAVTETFDSGYVFCGSSQTNGNSRIIRTNKYGEIIWNKFFNDYVYERIIQILTV